MSTSLEFDNPADYIFVENSGNLLNFNTNDFTIEWWQYQTDENPYPRVFSIGSYTDSSGAQLAVSLEQGEGGGPVFYFWSYGSIIANFTISGNIKNTWIHFAIVRQSNELNIYMNGVSQLAGPVTNNTDYEFTKRLTIANEETMTNGASFNGLIYNFMWLNGIAKYSESFSPPTSIPSNFTSYTLLLNGTLTLGSLASSVTKYNVSTSTNIPLNQFIETTQPVLNTYFPRQKIGSGSYGQFWYGGHIGFPGFLYKKNLGVGGRRTTLFGAGSNSTVNSSGYNYNKYTPGGSGIGATSISTRRAKNRLATVCGPNASHQCKKV
jgi:hypothetical protein